ncbi:hypothetical protein JW968_04480 [Candidatus Woesearchaeota archaeon]|nr:hypothetical protein [Candidatus Woesearchaeota archaeon]
MCCEKCAKLGGWLLLIFGVLFLLVDLGVWSMWGIRWWTVAFVLAGLAMLGTSCCPMCNPKADKKKK